MAANGAFLSSLEYDFIGGGNVVIAANTYVFTSYSLESQGNILTVDQPDGIFSSTLEYSISSLGSVLISGQSNSSYSISLSSQAQALTVDNPSGIVNKIIPFDVSSTGKVYLKASFNKTLDFDLTFEGKIPLFGTVSGVLPGPTVYATGGIKPIVGEASLLLEFLSNSSVIVRPTIFGEIKQSFITFELESQASNPIFARIKDYELSFNLDSILTQATFGTASGSYDFSFDSYGFNLSLHSYDFLGTNSVTLLENYVNDVEINDNNNSIRVDNDGKTLVEIVQTTA